MSDDRGTTKRVEGSADVKPKKQQNDNDTNGKLENEDAIDNEEIEVKKPKGLYGLTVLESKASGELQIFKAKDYHQQSLSFFGLRAAMGLLYFIQEENTKNQVNASSWRLSN